MELNPYESDLLVLHKELKRQEEEFLQSLIISYDEGVQTKSIETLDILHNSQEVIELYQRKSSAYRDELIPKEDAENYYYSDFNEKYSLKLDALKRMNNIKTEAFGSLETRGLAYAGITMNGIFEQTQELIDQLQDRGMDPFELTEMMLRLQKDLEEWMTKAKAEIERSKVKKILGDYMSMLKSFEPGSSSAEATEVFISFYKRMLSYL